MKLKITKSYLFVATLICGSLPVNSQGVATCNSPYSDSDGDGWGWENNASCFVSVQLIPVDSTCVDTDGDGWGWDGSNSCLVTESSVHTASEAIDCIDSDGDGWGWNGVESCIVNAPVDPVAVPSQSTVTEPYLNRYETKTEVYWGSRFGSFQSGPISDAITNGWIDGNPDAPLGYPSSYSSTLVLCEDPDNAIEDPSNPGLYFDAALGKACAKSNTFSIPAPEPVEFTSIGVEVLYENGNQWSCAEETRPSMDSEFEPNGNTGELIFNPSSVDSVSVGNTTYTDGFETSDFGLSLTSYRATSSALSTRVSYTDDGLTLYRSGLTRLRCQRIVEENYPLSLYGEDKAEAYREMWDAFIGESTPKDKFSQLDGLFPVTDFAPLSGTLLAGNTLQCGGVYGNGTLGASFSTEETVESVTAAGGSEYDFSGSVWTEIENGKFQMLTGSGGFNRIFYQYTDNLFVRYTHWSGAIGSSSGFGIDVAVCESN